MEKPQKLTDFKTKFLKFRSKFWFVFGLISILLFCLLLGLFLRPFVQTQSLLVGQTATRYNFELSPAQMPTQTYNDCGPFSATASLNLLFPEKDFSPNEIVQKTPWRLPNDYTLPFGVEQILSQNQVQIEHLELYRLSRQEKLEILQNRLSNQKPLILLIGDGILWQHYLTLVGFDQEKKEFYSYDSLKTTDENGPLSGNRTFTEDYLYELWSGGGLAGVYQWYALSLSRKN